MDARGESAKQKKESRFTSGRNHCFCFLQHILKRSIRASVVDFETDEILVLENFLRTLGELDSDSWELTPNEVHVDVEKQVRALSLLICQFV